MASRTLIGARLLRRMVHFIDIDIAEPGLPRSRSHCVSDVPAMRAVRIEQLMASADFSLRWSRDPRRPFRRKARSPRVRTSAFAARSSSKLSCVTIGQFPKRLSFLEYPARTCGRKCADTTLAVEDGHSASSRTGVHVSSGSGLSPTKTLPR